MCQTNLSSMSQTASRNYPSYVCTRPWGPIISRTGFLKTSPTFSLLQSQPSTSLAKHLRPHRSHPSTVRGAGVVCRVLDETSNSVEWQKAFLTRRTQSVKLANTKSDWTEVADGVPQGTLSGPENFLNMIDDLHTEVDDVKFVDDVTLYEVCNTHSQNKLHNAVDDIQEWATYNNMSLNTNKTKELLVYFGREDLDIPRTTINGDVIERMSCAKLLGCHIMSNLSWEDHIVNLVSKACRRLHLLRELKRAGLSAKYLLTCYFSFVRSKTEYACQVWSAAATE